MLKSMLVAGFSELFKIRELIQTRALKILIL